MKKRSRRTLLKRRLPILVAVFIPILLVCTVIAAITRLSSKENEFVLGTVIPVVYEDFDTNIKEDVYVKNEGNSPIYIRVSVVYNFVDQNGVTLFESPVSTVDYAATFSNSNNWLSSPDGYYYYKSILEPNDSTDMLIESIEDLTNSEEKMLSVNVVAQGIQAHPDSAIEEAWGVNVNNGALSLGN